MNQIEQFIFESYAFDKSAKTLSLHYSFDGTVKFKETYHFPFDFVDYSDEALDQACKTLFVMAGISYYKAYAPKKISFNTDFLTKEDAGFFKRTYKKGLGEFFYNNNLDPSLELDFGDTSTTTASTVKNTGSGLLIAIGGGKDSLLSYEILSGTSHKIATWSVGHAKQLNPLITKMGSKHFTIERTIDPALLALNETGVYNGHIPISALFGAIGSVLAVITGYRDVVVSNENSANEPTLVYQGVPINHQYSKSSEFEKDYQVYLRNHFDDSLRYYSFLRPLSELYIADLFSKICFGKYRSVFSSCNRAFTQHNDTLFWCGKCAKCAFVFLILTPFIQKSELETLFEGKNLLENEELYPMYEKILGIDADKPLDCVGEIEESRHAMKIAQGIYPRCSRYVFELRPGYDYKQIHSDDMPVEIREVLTQFLEKA